MLKKEKKPNTRFKEEKTTTRHKKRRKRKGE